MASPQALASVSRRLLEVAMDVLVAAGEFKVINRAWLARHYRTPLAGNAVGCASSTERRDTKPQAEHD